MKFWQKTYFSVLVLFLAVFDAGSYTLFHKSYLLNEQTDKLRAASEFESIEKSLSYILNTYTENTGQQDYTGVIASFADHYRKDGIHLEVYQNTGKEEGGERNSLIYSNSFQFDGYREELSSSSSHVVYRRLDGVMWIFAGGEMEFQDLRLIISRDSSYLQEYRSSLLGSFTRISILFSGVLSIILIVLLIRITSPIQALNKGVQAFAAGAYHKRITVKGQDEIAELAGNFNSMAEAVARHMEAIRKSDEDKQTFINSLTHELKTPITAIKGYSEFLTIANSSEEDRRMALAYIYENVTRLDLLSATLLELMYLQNEQIKANPVNIAKLFDDVQKMVQPQLEAKQIEMVKKGLAERMDGDEILLQTLLLNLIDNSIKASPAGGKIILKSYWQGQNLVLEVTDFGKGIPGEEMEKITEAFYVIDKSRSRELGGTGLGLSICTRIARLHEAEITIQSVEGQYTTVMTTFYNSLTTEE